MRDTNIAYVRFGKFVFKETALATYSIQLRLQRTTHEHCFVAVPVTTDILDPGPEGARKINIEKMTQAAIQIALSPDVRWLPEDMAIQPHPIQRPKEPGE